MNTISKNHKYLFIFISAVIILATVSMFSFYGCSGAMYKVDYCGQKEYYENAQDSYKAGSKVELHYTMVATEYSYNFYLDGESIGYDYDEVTGYYVISFVMPDRDVVLECDAYYSWGVV